uniref:Fucosyltransferase n=1 Tax=Acrobeloides nanus TaxID=290746 RepID=A0A914EJ46_9BILA
MTYRLDSDVIIPYDKFEPIDKNTKDNERWTWEEVKEKVDKKSKMVLQFVLHCSTPSKRENYIKELAKYIDVKIFGRCSGDSNCEKECEKNEIDQHMFYLSFENSICKDYVTEKFWRLKQIIVPIVMNREIHQHIAPNGSCIAASDFKSPKELANFLKQLASNKEEYIK